MKVQKIMSVLTATAIMGMASCSKDKEIQYLTGANNSPLTETPSSDTNTQRVRTGSGGDGVACYDPTGKLEKVLFWDFIEAEYRNGQTIELGGDEVSVEEKLKKIVTRITSKLNSTNLQKSWDEALTNYISALQGKELEYFGAKVINFINKGVKDNPKVNLGNLQDLKPDIEFTNKNCNMIQLAKQDKEMTPGSPLLLIDDYYFSRMSKNDQAGLLAHEFFLIMINQSEEGRALDSTFQARNLNNLSASNGISTMKAGVLFSLLEKVKVVQMITETERVDHHYATTVAGKTLLAENYSSQYGEDSYTSYTAADELHINALASLDGVYGEGYTHLFFRASKARLKNGKLESAQVIKDELLEIPVKDNGVLQLKIKERGYAHRYTYKNDALTIKDCGIYFINGERKTSQETIPTRRFQVLCLMEDSSIQYGDQTITYAMMGTIGFEYMPGSGDQNFVSDGIIYGGQKFTNPDGDTITLGEDGKCAHIGFTAELDKETGKPAYTAWPNPSVFECPKIVKSDD